MGSIKREALLGLREIRETLEEILKLNALSAQEKLQVEGALICLTHALNGNNVEDLKRGVVDRGYLETIMLLFLVLLGGILVGLTLGSF